MNTTTTRRFTSNIRTILTVAALLTCAHMAAAAEPAVTCKRTTTITTAPDGSTVIRTHKVCVVTAAAK